MTDKIKVEKKTLIELIEYLKKLPSEKRHSPDNTGWWCQIKYENNENSFHYNLDTVDEIETENIKDIAIYTGDINQRYYINK